MKNPELTIRKVFGYYGIPIEDQKKRSRNASLVRGKHIAMHLLRQDGFSTNAIGALFGMNHSSIIHATQKISERLRTGDPELSKEIAEISTGQSDLALFATRPMLASATPLDTSLVLNGVEYEAGDYLVMNGSTFAVPKYLFEKLFQRA